MARITVTHRHGESFDIRVRGYALISDEPITLGGEDEGPTPSELMVAGLAASAAEAVVKCLAAVGDRFEPTKVGADFAWDAEGSRITAIRLSVTLPRNLSASTSEKVLQAMLSCPPRKMLAEPPSVDYKFESVAVPASVGPVVDRSSWPEEPPPDVDSQG